MLPTHLEQVAHPREGCGVVVAALAEKVARSSNWRRLRKPPMRRMRVKKDSFSRLVKIENAEKALTPPSGGTRAVVA